jgi:hypothetical protein
MKNLKLLILLFFIGNTLFSQDTIVLVNQEKILSKIIEINVSNIKYKKSNNIDGPDYFESKSNIKLIKYANGFVDSIQVVRKPETVAISSPAIYNRIEKIAGNYYFVDFNHVKLYSSPIGINRFLIKAKFMSEATKNKDLALLVKKTKKSRIMQVSFGVAGIAPLVIGAGVGIASSIILSSSINPQEKSATQRTANFAFGLATIGLGFEITSIVNGSMKRKHFKETINKYNELAK